MTRTDRSLRLVLVTLGDPGTMTGGYLYHRRIAELAPARGAAVRFVSFPERAFPFPALSAAAALRAALRGAPDAVLLDSIAAGYLAPAIAARAPGVPLVGVLHQPPGGIDGGWLRRSAQAPLDRLAWRRCALLIAASQALAEDLARGGLAPSRIRVVPPGRDVAEPPAHGRREDLRRGARIAVLAVGNWVSRKGILDLLEAFAALEVGDAHLHLVGDPNREPRYGARVRARLAAPDLAGRVTVHGAVPTERVAELYAAADAFVLPSRLEPYGTVYGEAMAAGLPVVGWDAGNLPHLARDGVEGLVLPPGDIRALSAAMSTLARDDALRRAMGAAAARRARSFPTWGETADLFVDAVREAVGRGLRA